MILKRSFKFLRSAILMLLVVATVLSICVLPASVSASDDEVKKLLPYSTTSGTIISDISISVGIHLNVSAPVVGMDVQIGTYHRDDVQVKLSAYKWKGTFVDTVTYDPVGTGKALLVDNVFSGVLFDKEIPAGEYLFLVHEITKTSALYLYESVTGFEGVTYIDGFTAESTTAFPAIRIYFTEDREQYFEPCSESTDIPDGTHTAPEEYVIPEDSAIYTHEVMPDTWVFTDGLGRVSLTQEDVGPPKEDKTVAMFYWTWHISGNSRNDPANLQELSTLYPEAMRDYDNALWTELGPRAYFWNEPIYGYYQSNDAWVQRKQGELLANAGVDVVFTDNTNGTYTWIEGYRSLFGTWSDAMADGVKTPKISFMLPFGDEEYTRVQVSSLYMDIFRQDKWRELWFYWDDKPMLMAMGKSFRSQLSATYNEILNFFTFRSPQPEYVKDKTDYSSWGWLSIYPQSIYYKNGADKAAGIVEMMTVGVAQNHNYRYHVLAAMSGNSIMGRSYTSDNKKRYNNEGAEASKWGYNFAEQWNYALEVDPQLIFVTGWNEWTAGRFESWPGNVATVENAFPDQYIDEFSRDIEPTKGELKDHYYYQLVNFIRQYKGVRAIPTPTEAVAIDIDGGIEQWSDVGPYYAAYMGNTEDRNAEGYGSLVYTETSGRNDIMGAKIARDGQYVYFLVECVEDITPYTDKLWMNLYIDCDQKNQGWNTFEFVVNKSAASADTLVLEKFTATDDYSSTVKIDDVEYTLDGRYLTVKIPKSALELDDNGNDYTINFAWTDNVHDEGDYENFNGDIMDFYISGDVAPGGRFKYSYISSDENTGELPVINTPVDNGKDTEPTQTKSGCASYVDISVAVVSMVAMIFVFKKKED